MFLAALVVVVAAAQQARSEVPAGREIAAAAAAAADLPLQTTAVAVVTVAPVLFSSWPGEADMARYAILDAKNRIVNRCEWDGVAPWAPPDNCTAMLESDAIVKGYTDAPPAPGPRVITPRQFMDRIPLSKQRAIAAAATQSPDILLLMLRLSSATEVDLDMDETRTGVAAMQGAGLISADEAKALLG